jgi:hypothetical protein
MVFFVIICKNKEGFSLNFEFNKLLGDIFETFYTLSVGKKYFLKRHDEIRALIPNDCKEFLRREFPSKDSSFVF